MTLEFHHYNSAWVAHIRQGGADDYGQPAERAISDGAGQITLAADIERVAGKILAGEGVTFVDVRSARNNCFQCRVTTQV